jgi:hypothetical protein
MSWSHLPVSSESVQSSNDQSIYFIADNSGGCLDAAV